jgi:hypothetical protein
MIINSIRDQENENTFAIIDHYADLAAGHVVFEMGPNGYQVPHEVIQRAASPQ